MLSKVVGVLFGIHAGAVQLQQDIDDNIDDSTTEIRSSGASHEVGAPTAVATDGGERNMNTARFNGLIKEKLKKANIQSKNLRHRLTLMTVVVGLSGIVICVLVGQLLSRGTLSESTFGAQEYWSSMYSWFGALMLLGCVPTDGLAIRIINLAVVVLGAIVVLGSLGRTIKAIGGKHYEVSKYDGEVMVQVCGEGVDNLSCIVFIVSGVFTTLANAFFIASCITNLLTVRGAAIFDRKAQKGFKFKDTAFKRPARAALERLWLTARIFFFSMGVNVFISTTIWKLHEDDILWFTDNHFRGRMFFAASWSSLSAVLSAHRRGRIMAFLTALNAEGEAMCAASIAALLGGRDATLCLDLAKDNFRAISFDKLTADHFADNRTATRTNDLFDHAEQTKLGKCDAFISHSWSDNGKQKFRALSIWCAKFKTKHNREPKLWLDKACINQSNIANDLLCLPVFLAGCEELLVVAGPSYTSRLWCIIEVFTFLKMGGDRDRITVVPIDVDENQKVETLFDDVDVSTSECFLDEDRQRLLGIVQTGFGNFEQFNQILRNVLHDRMLDSIHSGMIVQWKSKTNLFNRIRSNRVRSNKSRSNRRGSEGNKIRPSPSTKKLSPCPEEKTKENTDCRIAVNPIAE